MDHLRVAVAVAMLLFKNWEVSFFCKTDDSELQSEFIGEYIFVLH